MALPPLSVFISYAHKYKDWAKVLHDNLELCLESAGREVEVFLDENGLESGRSWVHQLEAGLDRAGHLVLIATPEAIASPRVADEVRGFIAKDEDWSRGHFHVAMLVETPLSTFLKGMQWVDFLEHDGAKYRKGIRKLAVAIAQGSLDELPAEIAVPPHPQVRLAPVLRAKLLEWLEPVVARRIYRTGLSAKLRLREGTLEGHPSPACCASALLVEATADDDPALAALRVVKTLNEELGEDEPERVAELAPIRAELEKSIAEGPDRGLLHTYLEKVDRDHRTLVPYFQQGAELELLDRVYVQLGLSSRTVLKGREPEVGERMGQALGLREVLALDPENSAGRWVVKGDPGSGKTTLLRHLAGTLARGADPSWIPVFESLPRLMREREWLFERIARKLDRAGHPAKGLPAVLEREAQEGRLLLLLDGLDEVPKDDREDAEGLLRDLSARWPATPLVVTSRPIGYRRPGGEFLELDLLPFDHERRGRFLARWFGRRTGETDEERAEHELASLEEDPSLRELAGNPLYLTLMALLLEEGQAPHRNRTRLYDQVFELLLEGKTRPGGEPMEAKEATRAVLRYLAEAMTRENLDAEPVSKLEARLYRPEADQLREPLERVPRWRRSIRPFLEEMAERTGILGEHDGSDADWRFWHRTFREALAAEQLEETYRSAGPEAILKHARGIAGDESRWAEPYALLAGRVEGPDDLIRALVEENRALGLRAVATAQGLGAATLDEILGLSENWMERSKVYSRLPELIGESERALALIDRLRRRTRNGNDLYFLGESATEVGRRWEEAKPRSEEILGRLFDHIPPPPEALFERVDTPIDGNVPLWREIPAGSFQMGTPEGEEKAWEGEWSQHPVTVASAFRLAAVPITNAQYVAFDPGHQPKEWRGVEPAELGYHPVAQVTWYEAVAFCRWLSAAVVHAEAARLPSEEEWEYACRAGTTTRYWSGDQEADLDRVGWYRENSQGRTHRVGEKLANPWGLYDVHGNVWEWTASPGSTEFSKREDGVTIDPGAVGSSEENPAPSGLNRVLRGGGYQGSAGNARAANRFRFVPESGYGDVGFRVVLPGPRSGSIRDLGS